ncbi:MULTISPECIES: hypothetical protein [Methylobacterium]|jgi:hypothetical protein|uniref:Phage holin family protein n=1 Tax=Methylobacterium longum TaxID=767694 RepID=A0ABT8AX47_9HYPH|nr:MULTISPECIES: hypothetical protein [Methylobacterium]MCJ2103237.1 hypothetical protein [Methylobacterium sp. E-046]MDN3574461.1 hypothetical protein [Methylobacterium longum]GJE13804.1 hypothetical protein FOHLNKBM_4870 [Methylobacterium longum]
MLLLVAVAIGSGLVAAAILAPISLLAALIVAPLAGSFAAVLGCFAIAWRSTGSHRARPSLDAQTDAMVASLRGIAQQGATSPVPKVRADRHRAA